MPGRKKIPTAIKLAHGNPGKRPLNKLEPKYTGTTKMPSWVPQLAKDEFERISQIVGDLELLKPTDQATFEAYCVSYAAWRQAETRLMIEGEVVLEIQLDKHNNPIRDPENGNKIIYKHKRHPLSIVAKDRMAAMVKIAASFGFDPSSRSRVQIPDGPEKKKANDNSALDYLFDAPGASTDPKVH